MTTIDINLYKTNYSGYDIGAIIDGQRSLIAIAPKREAGRTTYGFLALTVQFKPEVHEIIESLWAEGGLSVTEVKNRARILAGIFAVAAKDDVARFAVA